MAYKKKSKQLEKKEAAEQGTIEKWRGRIADYKRKASDYLEEGKEGWNEALDNRLDEDSETRRGDRAYAHVSRFIESSYYSRKPRVIGSGDFDRKDEDALTAAYLVEKLGKRFVDDRCFSESIKGARGDFIHTSRGLTRVYVKSEWVDIPKRNVVIAEEYLPEPELDPETGMAMPPEPQVRYLLKDGSEVPPDLEILQDNEGMYVNISTKEVKTACPYLSHVSYKDYFHTPGARNKEMLTWEAYKLPFDKEEIKTRWKDKWELIKELKASQKGSSKNDYFEIYECWEKADESICYLFLDGEGTILEEVKENPFKIEGFFPSVGPIVSNKLTDKLWGVSDFTNYKDKLTYLKGLDRRRKYLSTLLRRNGIGDGKHREALIPLNENQRDGDIIFVDNYRDLVSDGQQSDTLIKFFPVKEYVEAFAECNESYFSTKQEYYEYFGLEKLLQTPGPGQAQQSEEDLVASLGLLYTARIREFQDFVQENIRVLIDLAIQVLPLAVFKQLVGFDFLPAKKKERFDRAYEILQSDFNRAVRVDIDTDSTVASSKEQEASANMQLFQTVTQSLGPLTDIAQTKPEFVAPLSAIVYSAISKMQGGKAVNDELSQSFSQLIEMASQPPPADTGPDLDEQKLMIQQALADHKINIENREQEFKEFIEVEKKNIAAMKADLDSQEAFMQEKRLADEQRQKMLETVMKLQIEMKDIEANAKAQALQAIASSQNNQPQALPAPEPEENTASIIAAVMGGLAEAMQNIPQPIVNVQAPQPTRRVGRIEKNGDTTNIVVDEEGIE